LHAKQDIFNNLFDNCGFKTLETGIQFGVGTGFGATGFQYGPRKNIIKNSRFESINQYGIIVDNGTGNRSRSNTFIDVGNDSTGNSYTPGQDKYSIIKFTNPGNSSIQDIFDRAVALASGGFVTSAYLAEVEGAVFFSSPETRVVNIGQAYTPINAFRIPLNSSTGLTINYMYQSTAYEQMRKGTLSMAIDRINGNIQLVDDFDYAGAFMDDENFILSANFETIDSYTTIVVSYINYNISDVATLTYSYSALS
jgi:hypothetical protein